MGRRNRYNSESFETAQSASETDGETPAELSEATQYVGDGTWDDFCRQLSSGPLEVGSATFVRVAEPGRAFAITADGTSVHRDIVEKLIQS